jgi:hypothetical protein
MQSPLTILNHYEIQTSPQEFVTAITQLAARVKSEGHMGVLSYRFYCAPDIMQARAIIDYSGPTAWIGHHDIAMAWPEMMALHNAARLAEVTFLGEMTPEIGVWISASGLRAKLNTGFSFAAGFVR